MHAPVSNKEKKPLVLIVDDTLENINVLGNILKNSGYAVVASTNGPQALQVAEARQPDLVLLDIQMPGMDGFEVCRRLKEKKECDAPPIIFLTAKTDPSDIVRGFECGSVDYVTKPFNSAELLARVRNHLELKFTREKLLAREKELEEANAKLLGLSMMDPLTGIANRRQLDKTLEVEWKQACREGNFLGLVMCDIDHFKIYNDTYGHQCGDECLKKVAEAISMSLHRARDLAARYGGEEFVLVLPGTDLVSACKVALNAIHNVAALSLPHVASPCGHLVTISAGVSCCMPQHNDNLEVLIAQADQALYVAKEKGRNRMEFFTLSTGPGEENV